MARKDTDFEIVDTPRSEGLCINGFVADRARVATTCHGACARIDTELEAQVMYLVCCSLDTLWKSIFISVGSHAVEDDEFHLVKLGNSWCVTASLPVI
jgi:hypothetical protein